MIALTIAGSDSSGGAGIQQDLKTFTALGVYGASVITAITAQNTKGIRSIFPLSPKIVSEQINAVLTDIKVDAIKTGMLANTGIVEAVVESVGKQKNLVVDPVMISWTGASLLEKEAIKPMKELLLPLATLVTPNIYEASHLSGIRIRAQKDVERAAKEISQITGGVLVTGGHLKGKKDLLYYNDKFYEFPSTIETRAKMHGIGCAFSAAITAELAKGREVPLAVEEAKKFIELCITSRARPGKGSEIANPLAKIDFDKERFHVLNEVRNAVACLASDKHFRNLIPEVGSNLAMAIGGAQSLEHIVGVDGRLRKGKHKVLFGDVIFGASSHMGPVLLVVMKHDRNKRAILNIKYSREILRELKKLGYDVAFFDRRKEPTRIKGKEGASLPWIMEKVIEKAGKVPNIVSHGGDWGKEPMIWLLGNTAHEVAKMAIEIARRLE
jgi:hydroxymethylpyrimidine/phosphomethylpyrimidine kinase